VPESIDGIAAAINVADQGARQSARRLSQYSAEAQLAEILIRSNRVSISSNNK
jgi:hypothetical protein